MRKKTPWPKFKQYFNIHRSYGVIKLLNMKIIFLLSCLLLLANCAQNSVMKFGKKCTVADASGNAEMSYIWLVDKNNKIFNQKINKENCKKNI